MTFCLRDKNAALFRIFRRSFTIWLFPPLTWRQSKKKKGKKKGQPIKSQWNDCYKTRKNGATNFETIGQLQFENGALGRRPIYGDRFYEATKLRQANRIMQCDNNSTIIKTRTNYSSLDT